MILNIFAKLSFDSFGLYINLAEVYLFHKKPLYFSYCYC